MKRHIRKASTFLLAMLILVGSFSIPAFAAPSDFEISHDSRNLDGQVELSVTITNTASTDSKRLRSVERNATNGIFDNLSFVEDSVQIDGVPANYTYDLIEKTLSVKVGVIPAGESRTITYLFDVINEGRFARQGQLYGTGGAKMWGSIPIVVSSLYNVTYDANGGSGTGPDTEQRRQDEVFYAANNTFAPPDGYVFAEWNTAQNGSGTSYAEGAEITMPAEDLTLYAIWKTDNPALPSMLYNLTVVSGPGGTVDETVNGDYEVGDQIALTATPDPGYHFVGWTSNAGGTFEDAASAQTNFVMPSESVTLTAKFEAADPNAAFYSVTYDANGGSGSVPTESQKEEGAVFTAAENTLTAPEGYAFAGWNTAADGSGTTYAAGAEITMPAADLTLYALWTQETTDLLTDVESKTDNGTNIINSGNPDTSDSSSIWAWIALASASLLGLLFLFYRKGRFASVR